MYAWGGPEEGPPPTKLFQYEQEGTGRDLSFLFGFAGTGASKYATHQTIALRIVSMEMNILSGRDGNDRKPPPATECAVQG